MSFRWSPEQTLALILNCPWIKRDGEILPDPAGHTDITSRYNPATALHSRKQIVLVLVTWSGQEKYMKRGLGKRVKGCSRNP